MVFFFECVCSYVCVCACVCVWGGDVGSQALEAARGVVQRSELYLQELTSETTLDRVRSLFALGLTTMETLERGSLRRHEWRVDDNPCCDLGPFEPLLVVGCGQLFWN